VSESDHKIFTTAQISKIVRVAPRTVATWIDTGTLKGYRLPGSLHRRVLRDDLEQFLKDHAMPSIEDLNAQ